MGFFSKFEGKMEDAFEGAVDHMANSPISPVQIAKKAEKQMRREKMVGAGKQYAPTLYTVLVNPDDDRRLFGYYPTLAGETETYLAAKAAEEGLVMDGQPLVRFIVDESLKHGKFDIIAEPVAAPIIVQLREEEMRRYGLAFPPQNYGEFAFSGYGSDAGPSPDSYAGPPPDSYAANPLDMAYANRDYQNLNQMAAESAAPAAAASHTVVFAGNQQAQTALPASGAVRARLVDTTTDRSYDLASSRLTIGRESKNDISVLDLNVSRIHAELRIEPPGVWVISDLGSTNGTFVNGREVLSHPLSKGDLITLGTTNFIFTQA